MIAALLLACGLTCGIVQEVDPVDRIVVLATDPERATGLRAVVAEHPEAARRAFQRALNADPGGLPQAARRIAWALLESWDNDVLVRRLDRYARWSPADRRRKLMSDSLRTQGNQVWSDQGVPGAMALWSASLRVSEQLEDTSGIAAASGNLGAAHYVLGEPDSAAIHYRRSHALAEASGETAVAGNAATMLATLARDQGDLASAASLYAQAVRAHEAVGEWGAVATDRHNLGLLALRVGDLDGARAEVEAALALSRNHAGPADVAEHLVALGEIFSLLGDYPAAEAALEEAARSATEAEGGEIPLAGASHARGLLDLIRGRYAQARLHLVDAAERYEQLGRPMDQVLVLTDLVRVESAAGEVQSALGGLRQAESIVAERGLGPAHAAARAMTAGELHLLLNQFADARDELLRAEHLYRQIGDVLGVGAALRAQAYVHFHQDDIELARSTLERALTELSTSGESPRPAALTRLLLAGAHQRAGDPLAASSALLAARDVFRALEDPVGEATALSLEGGITLDAGRPGRARTTYRQALELLGEVAAPDVRWRVHAGVARTFDAVGPPDSALVAWERAVDVIESAVTLPARTGLDMAFRADTWETYAGLARAQLELGRVAAAFKTSERVRGQRLLASMVYGPLDHAPGGSADPEMVELRAHIARLNLLLREAERGEAGDARRGAGILASRATVEVALEQAQRRYRSRTEELALRQPSPRRPDGGVEIGDLASVQGLLRDDEVLVEYLLGDSSSFVFAVTREASGVIELDETRTAIADRVRFARAVLDPAERMTGALWRAPLRRLHEILIQPLIEHGWMRGRTKMILVPHGELHYVPFAALLDRNGRSLATTTSIATAPSATIWARLAERDPPPSKAGVLAMAPQPTQLPGTRRELQAVRTFDGSEVVQRVGAQATESDFKQASGRHAILHLASSGRLNSLNPLFSYIELEPGGGEDGLLEVHEVMALSLDAQLVVLSACETGLGSGELADVPAGDDWVGLSQGFLAAGARNVLATLWLVDDATTAEVVREFYRAWRPGVTVSDALAQAQREIAARPETSHPFYWAGFTLVGEGRATR